MNRRRLFILAFGVVLAAAGCASPQPETPQTHTFSEPKKEVRLEVRRTEPAAAELAESLVAAGKSQYDRGLLNSAQRTLKRAVQVDPNNLKAWYYLHRVTESVYKRDSENQQLRDLLDRWRSLREIT